MKINQKVITNKVHNNLIIFKLLGVTLIFIFFNLFYLSSSDFQNYGVNQISNYNFSSTNSIIVKTDHPYSSKSFPIPNEEKLGENENLENTNDSVDFTKTSKIEGYCFNFCLSVKRQFILIINSFQNQPTIALFILHHSWKNFLLI